MKSSPELREKMWELCYDLLPEGERSALIAQIKSDPQAARLYAEVRLQADLVGYAATVEDLSLNLTVDAEKLKTAELTPAAGRRKEAAQPAAGGKSSAGKSPARSLWAANALAMAAGLALVLLIGVGLFRPGPAQVARLYVTEVEVPGQLTTGVTSKVAVRTASPTNQPVSVPVDVRLVDLDGLVRFHEVVATPADGRADVELPGDAIRPGTRLQVEARSEEGRSEEVREQLSFPEQQVAQQNEQGRQKEQARQNEWARSDATRMLGANVVEIDLPVSQPEPVTHYWTDKPVADEGEEVRVRGLAIDPYRLVLLSPPLDDLEVKEGEITRRVRPEWTVKDNLAEATIPGVSADGLERATVLADQQPAQPQPAEQKPAEQKLVEQKSFEKALSTGRKRLQVERAKDITLSPADRREVELRMAGGEGDAGAQGHFGYSASGDRARSAQSGAAAVGDSALARGVPAAPPVAAPAPAAPTPAASAPDAPLPGVAAREAAAQGTPAPDAALAGDQSGKEGKAKVGNTKEADKSTLASRDAGKEVVEKQTGEEPLLAKQLAEEKQDAVAPALDLPQLAKKQRQLVEADQPIEVELSLEQANKQLSATVESRGVQVAQQQVEPNFERYLKDGQALEQRATVTLNVPKEVVGNVDVTFYDRVANTVVLRRELYRAPARGLRFEVVNRKDRYDPGELVRLQFKVVDEHGEAASATNIVRVWNEDFVPDDRSQLVMLDDAVWKSESRAERAGEGEVLGQFGRLETVVEKGLALGEAASQWRRSRSGEADEALSGLAAEATTNRFAQSDAQASVAELKKAEDLAADAPTASTTAGSAAAALAPSPSPVATAPAGPANGPPLAPADATPVDALSATPEAMLGGFGAPAAGTQTYALAPEGYFAAQVPALTVSNEVAINRQLASLKSEHDRAAAAWRAMFGRVLIASGLVALAIMGLLFVMQQEIRWSSGTLALVASAASLVLGAVWITGGQQQTMIAMAPGRDVEAAGAAIDAPTMSTPAEPTAKSASPANASGVLAENMQEIAAVPDAEVYSARAPAKEATGDLATVPLASTVPPAVVPPQRPGGEGKIAASGLESVAPAKPATPADPDAKNELAASEKLAADDKQSAAKGVMPTPAGSGARGGRGGFGGGQGAGGQAAGSKDPAGRGARPEDSRPENARPENARPENARPENARPEGAPSATAGQPLPGATEPATDRLGAARRAAVRAGGSAGQEAAAGTTPAPGAGAPQPEAPAGAAPKFAASTPQDFSQVLEGERLKSRDSVTAPSAIYFNPQLSTGEGGIVTIEFQLPKVASEYRVLLDAYGSGRVGSSADVRIICKEAAK